MRVPQTDLITRQVNNIVIPHDDTGMHIFDGLEEDFQEFIDEKIRPEYGDVVCGRPEVFDVQNQNFNQALAAMAEYLADLNESH